MRNIIRQSGEEPPAARVYRGAFGFVPSWSRPEDLGSDEAFRCTHNARLEASASFQATKHATIHSAALIPVEAFLSRAGKPARQSWKMTWRDGQGRVRARRHLGARYRDGKKS
ncbi:MAG: hypothetical protein IPP88_15585 [Betaproteobacteria bacterium]|nr:hypothetical protein [Betaproteobacteria bacterium]